MQITIDIPTDLEQDLRRQAEQSETPLSALILQALHQLVRLPAGPKSKWSDASLSYEGTPDFPAFESYRDELLPPCKFSTAVDI
jgi:hypothetical protein